MRTLTVNEYIRAKAHPRTEISRKIGCHPVSLSKYLRDGSGLSAECEAKLQVFMGLTVKEMRKNKIQVKVR